MSKIIFGAGIFLTALFGVTLFTEQASAGSCFSSVGGYYDAGPGCTCNFTCQFIGGSQVCLPNKICPPVGVKPTVVSPTATAVTATSATLGATVASLGTPASISSRGTCWGTSASPLSNCTPATGVTTGAFSHSRTGLIPGTLYYYRGYARNTTGTGYSADGTFRTPTLDLTVSGVTPTTGTVGTPINFSATVTNTGTANIGGTFNNVFQIGTTVGTADLGAFLGSTIAGVNGGQFKTTTYSWTPTDAGTYYVRACADNNTSWVSSIIESNETNNCGSVWSRIDVAGPVASIDLQVINVNIGDVITNGMPVPLRAYIQNTGTTNPAVPFPVVFQFATRGDGSDAGDYVYAGDMTGLVGDQAKGFDYNWTLPSTTGIYYMRACADINVSGVGVVTEVRENNNCSKWTVVGGAVEVSTNIPQAYATKLHNIVCVDSIDTANGATGFSFLTPSAPSNPNNYRKGPYNPGTCTITWEDSVDFVTASTTDSKQVYSGRVTDFSTIYGSGKVQLPIQPFIGVYGGSFLTTAPWTVSGCDTASGVGAGSPWVYPGECTVTWGDVTDYKKPDPAVVTKTISLANAPQDNLVYGVYQPDGASIIVHSTTFPEDIFTVTSTEYPLAGRFTKTGKGESVFVNVPSTKEYTVVWPAEKDSYTYRVSPTSVTKRFADGVKTIEFDDPFIPYGTLNITSNKGAEAKWNIIGCVSPWGSPYSEKTGNWSNVKIAPGGVCTISWKPIPTFNSPADQIVTVAHRDDIDVYGEYVSEYVPVCIKDNRCAGKENLLNCPTDCKPKWWQF